MKSAPDRLTLTAFAGTVLLGGSNFVAVRFSNRELPPFWGAGLRFGAAAVIFMSIVALRRLVLPRGRALLGAFLFGLFNFAGSYSFVYWGLQRIPAGLGSVVTSTVPLLTLLLVSLQRIEPFRWRSLFGAILATFGIGLMFSENLSGRAPLVSLLALVAGAACISESGVVIKLNPAADPVTTNAVAMTAGSILLLLLSRLTGEAWVLPGRPETWAALGYATLLGSVGLFMLVIFVLKRWTASATSYSFVLIPIVSASESALLDREPITAGLITGALIVIAGVYFGAIAGRADARPGD